MWDRMAALPFIGGVGRMEEPNERQLPPHDFKYFCFLLSVCLSENREKKLAELNEHQAAPAGLMFGWPHRKLSLTLFFVLQ